MLKKVLCLTAALCVCIAGIYSHRVHGQISNGVIRFHVLANSDSDKDRMLKLKVRDNILRDFKDSLSASESREQTIKIINDNMEDIELSAEMTVLKNGCCFPVRAMLSNDYFPTKKYGDVTLPAGDYDALRIEIGEAKGHNWWCVMFPPLCYVDVTRCSIPNDKKSQLSKSIGSEGYKIITGDTTDVKIKLKLVELWEEIEEKF